MRVSQHVPRLTLHCRLPRASTCFWSFYLPRYSGKEVMRERIITAITSCGDIDNDFLVAH